MDASQISRLREEQLKAVKETDDQIKQFERFKSDYKALQTRLGSLPDKLSHDVMVPFGKLAFMPGKLVHTNEILVLLGDNWFVERSAKQACEIAGRRLKELDLRIQELKDQRSLLEPRLGFTEGLQAQAEGRGDFQEIVEEYDEEKEKLWDAQHKTNVHRYHQKLRQERDLAKTSRAKNEEVRKEVSEVKTEEEIWSRLDALEKQEEERNELNSSFGSDKTEEDDEDDQNGICKTEDTGSGGKISFSKEKRVSWGDLRKEGEDDDDFCDDDDEDSSDENNDGDKGSDDNGNATKPVIKTIHFSHTKAPTVQTCPAQGTSPTTGPTITSPADIYKLFSPKPILKKTAGVNNSSIPDSSGDHQTEKARKDGDDAPASDEVVSYPAAVAASRDKAFSGIVKENSVKEAAGLQTFSPEADGQEPPQPKDQEASQPKRVSKFRAQRLNQKPAPSPS